MQKEFSMRSAILLLTLIAVTVTTTPALAQQFYVYAGELVGALVLDYLFVWSCLPGSLHKRTLLPFQALLPAQRTLCSLRLPSPAKLTPRLRSQYRTNAAAGAG